MKLLKSIVFCLTFILISSNSFAQSSTEQQVIQTIFTRDSLFWVGYNTCDTAFCAPFIEKDVEFYHDKGGITLGIDDLLKSIKNNLCGNPDFRVRREAVKGTVNVYPLFKNNVAYGAIISGDHYFYITEKGKSEYRSGIAKFAQLWLLKDGIWKMARILSYDHRAY